MISVVLANMQVALSECRAVLPAPESELGHFLSHFLAHESCLFNAYVQQHVSHATASAASSESGTANNHVSKASQCSLGCSVQ